MSGLYRCRCRIGYRPYRSDKIIVFDERQVIQASLTLAHSPNSINLNQDSPTSTSEFVNALNGSTANVVLSDPYMTGLSWAALFDSAAAYNTGTQAAAYHILLPACKDGEDPASGKCTDVYQVIDDPLLGETGFGDFAHLILKFYYEVAGVTFGLDTYFRLQGFNISHGSTYPQVQLQGVNPQTIAFNQTLANVKFSEGETVDESLRKLAKDYNYEVSFCNNLEARSKNAYVMPRSFREKAVTAEEVMRKYIASVNGDMLSLPTREFANKISICTRGNVNQGCSVFYLGKGLYERYSISGNVDNNIVNRNTEYSFDYGLGYEFDSAPFSEETYRVDDILPNRRREKLRNAKTDIVAPQDQFTVYQQRFSAPPAVSGLVWRGPGPEVTTERLTGLNLYGIAVSGNKSLALLDGKVISSGEGRVLIATNYFIRYCDKNNSCYNKPIFQESVNLTQIKDKIKKDAEVALNEELGTVTADKPEFFRFYLAGRNPSDIVTIQPSLVWRYAAPYNGLTDEERARAGLTQQQQPPSSGSGDAPAPAAGSGGKIFIGKVGSTGRSSGPHIHFQFAGGSRGGSEAKLQQLIERYIEIEGGKNIKDFPRGDGYGAGRNHGGIDYGVPDRKQIFIVNGASVKDKGGGCTVENSLSDGCNGALGNFVEVSTPEGVFIVAHLAPGSVSNVTPGGVSGPGSNYGQGVQTGPATIGAEITTEFIGVPRALRIVPGRTVLSFITQYDEWIEKGRPTDIDPGIWIPQRFSNWFVKTAQYTWSGGNLRVSITGITDWGNVMSRIKVPKFDDYLESFKTEFKETKDYYGYIRSLGDLCWKVDGGKTSCEVICEEAQRIAAATSGSGGDGQEGSVSSSYPPADCQYTGSKYPKDKVNAIINAARQGGITTKAGYAGVVGNAIQESTLNPLATNRFGALGIFQWLGGRRTRLEDYARSRGASATDFNIQMGWFVEELKGKDFRGPESVRALNSTNDPNKAAADFDDLFERSEGSEVSLRQKYAREIFQNLSCQRINP